MSKAVSAKIKPRAAAPNSGPNVKAIPTVYAGVRYRSMLEARWAAWFSLVGIPVQYEPEAFHGYIPDFMPRTSRGNHRVIVEVKGALETFDLAKIRAAGWGADSDQEDVRYGNVWLLTSDGPAHARHFWRRHGTTEAHYNCDALELVYVCEYALGDEEIEALWRTDEGRLSVNPPPLKTIKQRALELWDEAGNLVQWRGAR